MVHSKNPEEARLNLERISDELQDASCSSLSFFPWFYGYLVTAGVDYMNEAYKGEVSGLYVLGERVVFADNHNPPLMKVLPPIFAAYYFAALITYLEELEPVLPPDPDNADFNFPKRPIWTETFRQASCSQSILEDQGMHILAHIVRDLPETLCMGMIELERPNFPPGTPTHVIAGKILKQPEIIKKWKHDHDQIHWLLVAATDQILNPLLDARDPSTIAFVSADYYSGGVLAQTLLYGQIAQRRETTFPQALEGLAILANPDEGQRTLLYGQWRAQLDADSMALAPYFAGNAEITLTPNDLQQALFPAARRPTWQLEKKLSSRLIHNVNLSDIQVNVESAFGFSLAGGLANTGISLYALDRNPVSDLVLAYGIFSFFSTVNLTLESPGRSKKVKVRLKK